jgi:hypothetical protein
MTEQIEEGKVPELKKGCVMVRERAAELVDEFLEVNYLDLDDYDMSVEDEAETAASIRSARRVLIKAVERGLLEFKEELDKKTGVERWYAYQHRMIEGQPTLKYSPFNGRALTQMKHVSERDNIGKIHAVMGSLAGTGRKQMEMLTGFEHKIMQNLGTIFLAQ